MADTSADAAEARALEQARIRKERREAKIRAGGASRLDKITGLGGGVKREPPPQPQETTMPTTTTAPLPTATPAPRPNQAHADPDEVDISQHYYQPETTARIPSPQHQPPFNPMNLSEAQLRQMMLGTDTPASSGAGTPMDAADDPMTRMMMQMMGGAAAGGAGGAPPNPFDMLSAMSGGGGGGGGGMPGFPPQMAQQQKPQVPDRYASLWRLLHTAVALGLGLYIALWTSFSGSKTDRHDAAAGGGGSAVGPDGKVVMLDDGGLSGEAARRFFYAFVTAEAVLLTTRFFILDRRGGALGGAAAGGGLLGMAVGFLPPAVRRYVDVGLKYGQIFGTVKADVLVCIFVLGVCSWFRS